jgi:FkbM family methyltransferase
MLISLYELIAKYHINLKGILHVGAHNCEEIRDYEVFLPRNKILWIDALKKNVDYCKNIYPGVLIEQAVVSDKYEKVKFNISNHTISSSIFELGLHKNYYPHIHYVDSFYADTKLLKDIIYKYNIHYNFLNLDIQGAELNALKGMENYLHKVEYIYTEVNCDYVYKDCPLIDEIDEYLKKFGFDRVETIWQAGCKWGDALYINRRYTFVTLFGTCRFDKIDYNTNLNNLIGYTHNTKEVLQFIRSLKGEIAIPPPYNTLCFKTAIEKSIGIDMNNHHYKHQFNNTKIFVIEICSRKKYIHNNYFLHHICVDKRMTHFNNNTPKDILDSYTIETQSDEEIENDIIEIQKLLYPRKVVIVSHYNSKINGEYIESRNGLICLLDKICEKHGISFVNPREALSQYTQEQLMSDNLSDYTEFGLCEFGKYMNNYINTLL